MEAKALRDILQRIETWPEYAQQQALDSLLSIEQELLDPYVPTDEDRNAIERGLDDMRHGRFASDEQVAAVFRRHDK
jgi:predicted transcriptional regulator